MLTNDEWEKLRRVINAYPDDDGLRIELHRVINRERDPNQPPPSWNEETK